MLRGDPIGRVVKDNIYFTIESPITYKVVIGGVEKRESDELVLGTEE